MQASDAVRRENADLCAYKGLEGAEFLMIWQLGHQGVGKSGPEKTNPFRPALTRNIQHSFIAKPA